MILRWVMFVVVCLFCFPFDLLWCLDVLLLIVDLLLCLLVLCFAANAVLV